MTNNDDHSVELEVPADQNLNGVVKSKVYTLQSLTRTPTATTVT